eukprot:TRINITY_DN42586_c0_g1_i1.p1 TRINITY_DN42586_c0_g1~~TRINITY_DN42586_c0_g1_i1.p1  ORF type:complete len:359 (-),score=48.45 TRINITY_DN42586_c0_g1_i1:318-1346(-)
MTRLCCFSLLLLAVLHYVADSLSIAKANLSSTRSHDQFQLSDTAWELMQHERHLLLRSESRKLLFCMLPKNACTEFLALVMRLQGFTEQHWNQQPPNRVHFDNVRKPLFVAESERAHIEQILSGRVQRSDGGNDEWTRAVILRNPVERLFSAYTSKVKTGYFKSLSHLSFEDFVAYLETEGLSIDSDPHFRPQAYLCGLNETLEHFNFVGSMDNLDSDAHSLVRKIGGDALAKEMLDSGWGPYGNRSLFGMSRADRDSLEAEPRSAGDLSLFAMLARIDKAEAGEYWIRTADEYAALVEFQREQVHELDAPADMSPQLVQRIERLYAMDYDLFRRLHRNASS